MNPFKVLGIAEDATLEDAKRAYRRLAKKYHPDICKDKDAGQKMQEITEAWGMLKDGKWEPSLVCRHKTMFTFTQEREE